MVVCVKSSFYTKENIMYEMLLDFIQNGTVLDLSTFFGFILTLFSVSIGFSVRLIRFIFKRDNDYIVIWRQPIFLSPVHIMGSRAKEKKGFVKRFYFEREQDRLIRKALEGGEKSILIVGNPISGKTRAAYEALKRSKRTCFVTVANMDHIDQREYTIPLFFSFFFWVWKRRYLFLDDLDALARKGRVKALIDKYDAKDIYIIATCRTGSELETDVGHELRSCFDVIVEIPKITDDEEKILRKEIPKKTNIEVPKSFDHNIGSIFLKVQPMKKRFASLDDNSKMVLLSIKQLWELGVYRGVNVFPEKWLIKKCQTDFGLNLGANDFQSKKILKTLENEGFLQREESVVRMEEAYLDFIGAEEKIELQDFRNAIPLFWDDPEALINLGNRTIRRGEVSLEKEAFMTVAIEALLRAVEKGITGYAFANAKNSLGNAYLRRSDVRGETDDIDAAIACYENSLEVFTIHYFPSEYAAILNNLGSAYKYKILAGCREPVEHLERAIRAFNEALKVQTLDRTSMNYAQIQNNLGEVYRNLAGYRKPVENLERAVGVFDEALQVYTLDRAPMDYAMTKNNLGTAYQVLAGYREPVENLERAVGAYDGLYRSTLWIVPRCTTPKPRTTWGMRIKFWRTTGSRWRTWSGPFGRIRRR